MFYQIKYLNLNIFYLSLFSILGLHSGLSTASFRLSNEYIFQEPSHLKKLQKKIEDNLNREPLVSQIVCRNKDFMPTIQPPHKISTKKLSPSELPSDFSWLIGKGDFGKILPTIYSSGKLFEIAVEKDLTTTAIFHKRPNSENLVVVAPGFGNAQTMFTPALWFFPDADIVTFDFRGHGTCFTTKTLRSKIFKKIFGFTFDCSATTLGIQEDLEILAVTEFFKSRRKYNKVIGLGFCFGAAMMAKTQAQYPDLFTHFIFDSLWPDLTKLVKRFLQDPSLVIRPQKNPGGLVNSFFTRYKFAQETLKTFAEYFIFQQPFNPNLSVCSYLEQIKIPIVLIYGSNDALIKKKDFEKVWSSIKHDQKLAIITEHKHLLTFLKDRYLYRFIADNLSQKGFYGLLQSLLLPNINSEITETINESN